MGQTGQMSIILSFLTSAISLGILIFTLVTGKKDSLLFFFVLLQFIVLYWSLTQLVEGFTGVRWTLLQVRYLGICFIGSVWLLFCLSYSNNRLPHKKWLLLFLPSLFFYIALLTTKQHNLFYNFSTPGGKRDFAILFWLHTSFSYAEIMIGTIFLTLDSLSRKKRFKQQTKLLIFVGFLPLGANSFFLMLKTRTDFTPAVFTMTLALFVLLFYKNKFLNILPMAMREMTRNMCDPFVILDNEDRILNFNPALLQVFSHHKTISLNENAGPFLEYLQDLIEPSSHKQLFIEAITTHLPRPVKGELNMKEPVNKFLMINIMPIMNKGHIYAGKIISFSDITEYIQLLESLNRKNEELLLKNCKILDQAEKVKELSIMKERNRIARDVHDTLGHTFTALVSQLEVCRIKNKSMEVHQELTRILDTAREGLKEIRRSISGIAPEPLDGRNFTEACRTLFEGYRQLGINIEFTAEEMNDLPRGRYADTLYRLCQEGVTNAIRHGRAGEINIILRKEKDEIKLFIIDNGTGCRKIIKGIGLRGMTRRVELLNGKISFSSNGEEGFNVHVTLPLK